MTARPPAPILPVCDRRPVERSSAGLRRPTNSEWAELPYAAMRAIKAVNYPNQRELIFFELRIGKATEYRRPGAGLEGIFGNFGVYNRVNVRLGARWNAPFQTGVLVHLENIASWSPDTSYSYSQSGGQRSLTLVRGSGPNRIAL